MNSWKADALCHGLTHLFFIDRGGTAIPARTLCAACPVRAACLEAGRGEKFGIWGGRTEHEREADRRRRRRLQSTQAREGTG